MQEFTIGRGGNCNIQVPSKHKEVGTHHATLTIDDEGKVWLKRVLYVGKKVKNYGVFVNGFLINRKRLQAADEINFANQHHFKLHYYFEMDGERVLRQREENNFTREMKMRAGSWKSIEEQHQLISSLSIVAMAIISLSIAFVIYHFTGNQVVSIILGSLPLIFFRMVGNWVNQKKSEITKATKKTNVCPKCGKFMDENWEQIKRMGHHESCNAFWKLN